LNLAIDREAVIKNALSGYGVVSSGPVSTRHWALAGHSPGFSYDPKQAADIVGHVRSKTRLGLTCLVAPNSLDERIALELKRQLALVGIDVNVEEASRDEIVRRGGSGDYEAAMIDVVSGPTIIRPYVSWHSGAPLNWGRFGNAAVDHALDRVRSAATEEDYGTAVLALQQAFVDDPPAVFLTWSVKGRAVSTRFIVPPIEPGRDPLSTLRLWRPGNDNRSAAQH
jgi:ABC-type transport system substrate-binding protein